MASNLEVLHDLALLIAAETDLDRVLERVVRAVETLLAADSATVFVPHFDSKRGARFTTIGTGEPHRTDQYATVRPGGMTEAMLRDNTTIAVENTSMHPLWNDDPLRDAIKSSLAVALRCEGKINGVLFANFNTPRSFRPDEIHLAELLAAHAATATRNAQLLSAERHLGDRLAWLLEMARAVTSRSDPRSVFDTVTHHMRVLLTCDEATIHQILSDGRMQVVSHNSDVVAPDFRPTPIPLNSFLESVFDGGHPVIDVNPSGRFDVPIAIRKHLQGVQLAAIAPMIIGSERYGLLIAEWRRPYEVNDQDLRLLETIARQTVIAIENIRLRETAVAAGRLEGTIKTAQAAAHELSQPLSVILGYEDLLVTASDPEQIRIFSSAMGRAAQDVTRKLEKFRNVMRFAELRFSGVEPILDLERSTETDGASLST